MSNPIEDVDGFYTLGVRAALTQVHLEGDCASSPSADFYVGLTPAAARELAEALWKAAHEIDGKAPARFSAEQIVMASLVGGVE